MAVNVSFTMTTSQELSLPNNAQIDNINLTTLVRMACVLVASVLFTTRWRLASSSEENKKNVAASIPGPFSLPIIGSVLSVGNKPHLSLTKLAAKYGNIFQIHLGSRPVVVINGLDTIRSALVGQATTFAGRPSMIAFDQASDGKSMAFTSYSDTWRLHRRLAERSIAAVADASFVSDVVVTEIETLVSRLTSQSRLSGRVNPLEEVIRGVAHIKYSLCYGSSRQDTEHFEAMMRATLDVVGCQTQANMADFFPWARRLLSSHERRAQSICDRMLRLTQAKEQEHLATYDGDRTRDILDALIRFGLEAKCPLDEERILHTVQEYIGAGLDIVYVTFLWILVYMTEFPEVQERLQQEVDSVVGSDRQPQPSDMDAMPYTEAFILEVLRHSCLVPFALPHSTTEDTSLGGYHIAKDTFVMVNMYSISRDETIWTEPEAFRPERFLIAGKTEKGQSAIFTVDRSPASGFLFGIGKRKCVGEKLSRKELFLFTTMLAQQCTLAKPPGVDHLNLEPVSGVVLRPQHFDITVSSRR